MSNTAACVITMGGTIDKDYVVDSASLEVLEPFIAWIAPTLGTSQPLEIIELAKKDSLDLVESDRAMLLDCLSGLDAARAVITHGTDTLLCSALAVLGAQGAGRIANCQTIAFTGAFRPGRFTPAEAAFNIGFALAVVQAAPPGVYVAVGGRFAPAERVRHEGGHFVYD
jgi:L-asparaginase